MNMEYWLLIILLKIVLTCLLFYTKIYLILKCKRDGSNDYIKVEVYFMRRLLVYSMQVPMIEITKGIHSLWVESKIKTDENEDKTHTKREQRYIKEKMKFYITHPLKLKLLVKQVRYYTRVYYQVLEQIIKSLYCEELCWKTSYGSKDAAITGIVSGMLWTVKALLLTNLQKKIVFKDKPVIQVNPVFGQTHLKVDFQCIFSIRLGNVITAMRSMYTAK